MTTSDVTPSAAAHGAIPPEIREAVSAARDKKALEVIVLDLRKASAFTDYFVICSGQNTRQIKTIADAIQDVLLRRKVRPDHVEGQGRAEWVLLDYFDFVIHIFTPETRRFFALERLWGTAEEIAVPDGDAGERGRKF